MWIDTFGANGTSGASGGDAISRRGLRPNATAAISSMRAERDQDQRDQQQQAEREGERGAGHEVVPVPEGEHDREPGADRMCAAAASSAAWPSVAPASVRIGSDSSTPISTARPASFQWSGLVIGPVQENFGCARGVEHAPVGADAAFEGLPRLVVGFDDVVVDAERLGARDEVAQHFGLRHLAGIGVAAVVARARPAELGDHDALAGIGLAQPVVDRDRLIDRGLLGDAFPVGQHVRGDEVDRGGELGMLDPGVPDFAGGDRQRRSRA